jgi:hypothetical protein
LAYRPRAQISNTKSLWFLFFNKIRMGFDFASGSSKKRFNSY